jgi:hypothetical protein
MDPSRVQVGLDAKPWAGHIDRPSYAGVVERVDTRDLKSLGRKAVPVRVRPSAVSILMTLINGAKIIKADINTLVYAAMDLKSAVRETMCRFESGVCIKPR